MYYLRVISLLATLAVLSACDNGVNVVTQAPNTGAASTEVLALNGIWEGNYTSTVTGESCNDLQALILDGQVRVVSADDCDFVLAGELDVNGEVASISFESFAADGSGTTGTANFSGSFTPASIITGTYSTTDGSDSGNFTLNYNIIYENDSTLASLATTWAFAEIDGSAVYFFPVNDAGQLSSFSTTSNCNYTGTFSIIDADYNLFGVSLTISGCTGNLAARNGIYDGVASLIGGNLATLTVFAGNDQNVLFADFFRDFGGGN